MDEKTGFNDLETCKKRLADLWDFINKQGVEIIQLRAALLEIDKLIQNEINPIPYITEIIKNALNEQDAF